MKNECKTQDAYYVPSTIVASKHSISQNEFFFILVKAWITDNCDSQPLWYHERIIPHQVTRRNNQRSKHKVEHWTHEAVVYCKVKNKTKDKNNQTNKNHRILLSEGQSITSFMIAVTQVKQIYFKFLSVSNIMRHYHN